MLGTNHGVGYGYHARRRRTRTTLMQSVAGSGGHGKCGLETDHEAPITIIIFRLLVFVVVVAAAG